jgi:hypothetical protein
MQYLLLFNGNNGYANASQYYVTRTVAVLFLCLRELYVTDAMIVTEGPSRRISHFGNIIR